jgi:LPPG:FO 2-phospho-L-lactate transferase
VNTDIGELAFQEYFVRCQCQPKVLDVHFAGADSATVSPQVLAALADPDLRAVIVCPSNPLLSIAPVLAVPGLRSALQATTAPVVVVSPLIGGKAVKGPTAKMMQELALPCDSMGIADFYRDIANCMVIDEADSADMNKLGMQTRVCKTLMKTDDDKRHLANALLAIVEKDLLQGR